MLCLGHQDTETGRTVIDVLQAIPSPHVPRDAINVFVATLKAFNCFVVWGDRYGGTTFSHDYQARGCTYRPLTVNKSVLYDHLEPAIAGGDVELLDDRDLLDEAMSLIERNGKADHPAGFHDDRINAVAAMAYVARQRKPEALIVIPYVADEQSNPTYDRWRPDWSGMAPTPASGSYVKDYDIGSLAWASRTMRARGEIK